MNSTICSVIIPTCRHFNEIENLYQSLVNTSGCDVVATCLQLTASENRNAGIEKVKTKIVIMVDDDTFDYPPGWAEELISPMLQDGSIKYVSARILNPNGTLQQVYGFNPNIKYPTIDIQFAPTACCAFWNDGVRFDEGYRGSGYEDTDFIMQLKKKYSPCRIILNNKCRVKHRNEMKDQAKNCLFNAMRFREKWGFSG